MANRREERTEVTRGTGNVFADLGFAEPEEELAKAQLLMLVQQAIKRRRLSQAGAAALMNAERSDVSALMRGRGASFSSARLMRLLTHLGQDVDIAVRAAPRGRTRGRMRVLGETCL